MSNLIEVKTVDLIGAALDYAVDIAISGEKPGIKHAFAWRYQNVERKDYSRLWRDGGPLIEKYRVGLYQGAAWTAPGQPPKALNWRAGVDESPNYGSAFDRECGGSTALIAVCRAIVYAKLGETVKIPVELMS